MLLPYLLRQKWLLRVLDVTLKIQNKIFFRAKTKQKLSIGNGMDLALKFSGSQCEASSTVATLFSFDEYMCRIRSFPGIKLKQKFLV